MPMFKSIRSRSRSRSRSRPNTPETASGSDKKPICPIKNCCCKKSKPDKNCRKKDCCCKKKEPEVNLKQKKTSSMTQTSSKVKWQELEDDIVEKNCRDQSPKAHKTCIKQKKCHEQSDESFYIEAESFCQTPIVLRRPMSYDFHENYLQFPSNVACYRPACSTRTPCITCCKSHRQSVCDYCQRVKCNCK